MANVKYDGEAVNAVGLKDLRVRGGLSVVTKDERRTTNGPEMGFSVPWQRQSETLCQPINDDSEN